MASLVKQAGSYRLGQLGGPKRGEGVSRGGDCNVSSVGRHAYSTPAAAPRCDRAVLLLG